MTDLQLWGGIECSQCRVGDGYYNQLVRNGHWQRISDLDAIADLGIKTLRYPVLWEHTAPESLDTCDWTWPDERLPRLRELGINPIVGLVHHGSGPTYTALHEDSFATGLARHAANVARRYPWLTHFTPVNEPLTTARFSCLYGHWYPHTTCHHTFVRALLNQLEATRLAMKAIREITPGAQLVQTEDLGQAHSTPALRERAEFENHRRWLSIDILCGRVTPEHPFWGYLTEHGASEEELQSWIDNPCPPDVLGFNHYVTSERFLDDETEHYPEHYITQNDGMTYSDVEAVRVGGVEVAGITSLLVQAWERYGRPLAITEAHLNSSRDEQVRWLNHVWESAQAAREAGADVRAVTVWSLLGCYDWNRLLTCNAGYYEPGPFDVRSGQLRPTLLAKVVCALAQGQKFQHPVMESPGWWHRPDRVLYRLHLEQTKAKPKRKLFQKTVSESPEQLNYAA
jgi:beta-glucosidase/6-phospho-beta-glucosidase/beta-galactosidase